MYTINRMKEVSMALLLLGSMSVGASEPMVLSLPPVAHADTEVVTNVPLSAFSRRAAKFAFSLGCRVTPTNNVEIAFGTDSDADGVLAPRETRLVVGWDSGILPRMKNDGTVTTNTAFGWLDGSLVWKVPFGWKGAFDIHTSITNPIGRFAEGTLQEMSINPRGDFSIKKLKHTAVRQIDGAVSVDGKSGDSVIEK